MLEEPGHSVLVQCTTHLTRWWMMWLPLVLPRLLQNQRLVALHITRVAGSLMPQ